MGVIQEVQDVSVRKKTTAPLLQVVARLHENSGIVDPLGTDNRTFNVNPSITIEEIIAEIKEKFRLYLSLTEYSFTVDDINLNGCDQFVKVIDLQYPSCQTNSIEIMIDQLRQKESATPEEMALGASASPTEPDKEYNWYDMLPDTKQPDTLPLVLDYQPRSFNRQETGFVGLVNQAMTCYLNSLLQALFMTPEFRNALYRWEFKETDDEAAKSIPFQLQKLFLQLQTTTKSAVETTNLTHSFGWDSSEAWQQHDIQELCRVMFDALEQCFKNTDQADLISNLYEGKMKDYVKCLNCGTENAREDTFLDIPLPIKPFGSDAAFHSLEEALQAFVEPEMLTDSNKYECSRCELLCDAHKGLKFTRFPYLLTIHLKRFDFDYQSLLRIKLNDKVTFPKELNLNSFVGDISTEEHTELKVETSIASPEKTDDTSTTDSGAGLDNEDGSNGALTPTHPDPREEDEGIDLGANCQERTKSATGPHIYELFSIMVHSGSASGGHYYAYIRDFKTNNWFCFNDQSVAAITYDDIKRTYGGNGSRSFYSSSSANAYMLIYRQIDPNRNANFFLQEEFPMHIKTLMTKMGDEEVAEKHAREMERNMIRVQINSKHPSKDVTLQKEIKIHKDETLETLTKLAWQELEFGDVIPIERCRLVSYEPIYDNIECAYDNREQETISSIINVQTYRKPSFYLETREENEIFEDYKDGGTSIKVYKIDLETEEVDEPIIVRVNLDNFVMQFRDMIAEQLSVDVNKMRIAKEERYPKAVKILEPSKFSLKREDITRSTKIFVEGSGSDTTEFKDSNMYKIIDRFEHTRIIVVHLPDTGKETLETLQIAPYVEVVEKKQTPINTQATSSELSNKSLSDQITLVPIIITTTLADISSSTTIVSSPSADHSTKVVNCCQSKPVCHTQSISSKSPVAVSQTVLNLSDNEEDAGVDGEANLSIVNSDQSASEDSSLTSDSDRTLVGDPPDKLSHGSNSPDYHNVSSPDESKEEPGACSWDYSTTRSNYMDGISAEEELGRYFRVRRKETEKELNISADNRMTVREFKKHLQKYVGVFEEHFKIYTKQYDSAQMTECKHPLETLRTLGVECKIILSRALQSGEYLVKVYSIEKDNSENPAKFLLEVIISEGQSVLKVKEHILDELKQKYDMNLVTDRVRLRKKSWKNPQTIFFDAQLFKTDIPFSQMNEIYVQELDGPEMKCDREGELCLFAKRWRPSSYTTEPLTEFIVPEGTIVSLKEQLSKLSGIPTDDVMFARGKSTFPCDMSVIHIETDLDWKERFGYLEQDPLYIMDDGCVIYYKDKKEELKSLSETERSELTSAENVRLHSYLASVVPVVARKSRERGLKIYLNQSQ